MFELAEFLWKCNQNAKSETKNIITIKHELKNFPILRILTMNIKHICPNSIYALKREKKKKKKRLLRL